MPIISHSFKRYTPDTDVIQNFLLNISNFVFEDTPCQKKINGAFS